MPRKVKLSPGDMVCIAWVDIQEGVNEPTEGAGLGSWETVAYWVGRVRSKGVPSIVIRYSRDPREHARQIRVRMPPAEHGRERGRCQLPACPADARADDRIRNG